jgi:GTPase
VTRCGFVALIGAPNAGKSTLLNKLVGAKLAIVSPKVQTTRSRLVGIAIDGETQIIFVDTPGIFQPRRRLDRAMVRAAWRGAEDADRTVLLIDAGRRQPDEESDAIIARLKAAGRTAILALNKIDACPRPILLALADRYNRTGVFSEIFMISSLTGDGVGDLKSLLASSLPEGPFLFPADQLSDAPLRLLAAETTREKLFLALHQEVPYALSVRPEAWEEFADGSAKITQTIEVERDSQKAIVIGKSGQRIKSVREAAQRELESLLGRRVHLFLTVVVQQGWAEDREHYSDLGLDFDA